MLLDSEAAVLKRSAFDREDVKVVAHVENQNIIVEN